MTITQNQTGVLPSAYGTLYRNSGNYTGESFSFTTSYQELASFGTGSWTLATPVSNFIMSPDGRLKYVGAETRYFLAEAYFVTTNAGGNFSIAIYKNGVLVSGAESWMSAASTISILPYPMGTLSTNDYISLYGKRSAYLS